MILVCQCQPTIDVSSRCLTKRRWPGLRMETRLWADVFICEGFGSISKDTLSCFRPDASRNTEQIVIDPLHERHGWTMPSCPRVQTGFRPAISSCRPGRMRGHWRSSGNPLVGASAVCGAALFLLLLRPSKSRLGKHHPGWEGEWRRSSLLNIQPLLSP